MLSPLIACAPQQPAARKPPHLSPLHFAAGDSPAVTRGNKTERASPLVFSFILALPLLGMYIYFVAYQTYV